MGFLPQIKLLDIFMFWEQEGYILDSHLMQTLSLSLKAALCHGLLWLCSGCHCHTVIWAAADMRKEKIKPIKPDPERRGGKSFMTAESS